MNTDLISKIALVFLFLTCAWGLSLLVEDAKEEIETKGLKQIFGDLWEGTENER